MVDVANFYRSVRVQSSIDRSRFSIFRHGWDGTSRTFAVKALRTPAIAEFRIHYNYPSYTHRAPLTVSNIDGLIEAPIGTEATVDVRTAEPVADGTISLGKSTIAMMPTATGHHPTGEADRETKRKVADQYDLARRNKRFRT